MVHSRKTRSFEEMKKEQMDLQNLLHSKSIRGRCEKVLRRLEMVRLSNWIFIGPTLIATIPTMLAIALKWYQINNPETIPEGVLPENDLAYSSLSWVLGFVLVFRTSQAYTRYWDGAMNLHRMTVELFDACSQVSAFAEESDAPRIKIDAFRLTMVRLFSLLHGVALQQITEIQDEDIKIIDPSGLDPEQLQYMRTYARKMRPEIVMQWIVRSVTSAMKTAIVATPPPIVSRVYQECNSGLIALAEMRAISDLPFPRPYAKMVWLLLGAHIFVTPFYAVAFTNARFWAGVYSFMAVFSLWCIQYIAIELEQPFGDGADDLDLSGAQCDMNDLLLTLLEDRMQWRPDVDKIAEKMLKETGTARSRISCQRLSTDVTLSASPSPYHSLKKSTSMAAALKALPSSDSCGSTDAISFRMKSQNEVVESAHGPLSFRIPEDASRAKPKDPEKIDDRTCSSLTMDSSAAFSLTPMLEKRSPGRKSRGSEILSGLPEEVMSLPPEKLEDQGDRESRGSTKSSDPCVVSLPSSIKLQRMNEEHKGREKVEEMQDRKDSESRNSRGEREDREDRKGRRTRGEEKDRESLEPLDVAPEVNGSSTGSRSAANPVSGSQISTPRRRELTGQILQSTQQCLALVNSVKSISDQEPGVPRLLSSSDEVRSAPQQLSRKLFPDETSRHEAHLREENTGPPERLPMPKFGLSPVGVFPSSLRRLDAGGTCPL